MFAGDERTHFGSWLRAGTDRDAGHAFADRLNQRICDIADGKHDGDSHASLAGSAISGGDGGIGGHGNVGVGQYQHVILGPPSACTRLPLRVAVS